MNNFSYNEFDSPDEIGSGSKMNQLFLNMLDDARSIANTPFIINSGYRTIEHNSNVGGKSNSSHLRGLAADIKVNDSRTRGLILKALREAGFNRIGIAKTFLHVDFDSTKANNVTWLYS